jgi:cell division protein FtsX
MLYVGLRSRTGLSIGVHGALLPLVLIPLGVTLGTVLGVIRIDQDGVQAFQAVRLPYIRGLFVLPVVVVVYYLVWKYIVAFLNDVVGIE